MIFIIFGPPGSGKGIYSSRIAPELGLCKISMGDIFRNAINRGTELGNKVESYVKHGSLVPDEIVIEVLMERISRSDCERGFILDGFPRTFNQAKTLDRMIRVDAIINLMLPKEIIIEKLSARRICEKCGSIYNVADVDREIEGIYYKIPPISPKFEGRCDRCGGGLVKREDDQLRVIKERLAVYAAQSKQIKNYYHSKIPFIDVYITRGIDDTIDEIIEKMRNIASAN